MIQCIGFGVVQVEAVRERMNYGYGFFGCDIPVLSKFAEVGFNLTRYPLR